MSVASLEPADGVCVSGAIGDAPATKRRNRLEYEAVDASGVLGQRVMATATNPPFVRGKGGERELV
jgi:hypothetical protein